MICPYCVEDVPPDSRQHESCRMLKNKPFPLFYLDAHASDTNSEPVILSVVGFSGHGKTVFLCGLFDFLDNHLCDMWRGFINEVLDQDSLSTLSENRAKLRNGILPPPTEANFPRPGIFRLTGMPTVKDPTLPPLDDTTVLICDPPGEAFLTEDKIVQSAGFVKRSSCVLFLIDVSQLSQNDSAADEMAKLLDTYLLGLRRMETPRQSQHLVVVFTKSDKMKSAVPEFRDYLQKHPELNNHLNEQRPVTLANPVAHLQQIQKISDLLSDFTWSELKAKRFVNLADKWFKSVSYTAVSSLGAPPEEGAANRRLTVKMSPRGVVDPLLYVLAKSIKKKLPPPTPPTEVPQKTRSLQPWVVAAIIGVVLLFIIIVAVLLWSGTDNNSNTNTYQRKSGGTGATAPTPPSGMTYVPGGEFAMGTNGGDISERPAHNVKVKPFFIDQYEVTREQYERFVRETGRAPPSNWRNGQYPSGTGKQPVTDVTWNDAVAYASWAGKRLPTEEEWEFAARGTDGYLYPWGNEFKAGMANVEGYSNGLVDVGTFKGVSPFGIYDMIGNAWEWTSSDLRAYPGGSLPEATPSGMKVIRGGSWQSRPTQATATFRRGWGAIGESDYSNTGFRCAKNLEH